MTGIGENTLAQPVKPPLRERCACLAKLVKNRLTLTTDSADPVLQLRLLAVRPGGWRDSVVRRSLPDELVAFLDSEAPADLGADLRALRDVSALSGWAAAVEGALRSLEATGGVDAATLELAAARAAAGDALVEYDEPVDLSGYDRAFGLLEGGAAGA